MFGAIARGMMVDWEGKFAFDLVAVWDLIPVIKLVSGPE